MTGPPLAALGIFLCFLPGNASVCHLLLLVQTGREAPVALEWECGDLAQTLAHLPILGLLGQLLLPCLGAAHPDLAEGGVLTSLHHSPCPHCLCPQLPGGAPCQGGACCSLLLPIQLAWQPPVGIFGACPGAVQSSFSCVSRLLGQPKNNVFPSCVILETPQAWVFSSAIGDG